MSTNIPIRAVRAPALQRQCLFQRRQAVVNRPSLSTSTSRTFSTTPTRCRKKNTLNQDAAMTRAAVQAQVAPAPKVHLEKAQREAGSMAEDIGLLQDTIVPASLGKLPGWWSPSFWGYFWKVLKSKGTALYSRSAYRRMVQKQGMSSYFPIDVGQNAKLQKMAQRFYEQIYYNFAKGDIAPIRRFCLPPLARNFQNRVAARGPLSMDWKLLKFRSARVVSHRASPLGEDHPDTAYRQVVVRLESTQQLSMKQEGSAIGWTPSASRSSMPKGLHWKPAGTDQKVKDVVKGEKAMHGFMDNGVPKKVVEYIVLQTKVVKGKQEDWKVWGFAEESTPQTIEEDAAYWRKTLSAQAGSVA